MKKVLVLILGLVFLTACRQETEKTAFVDLNKVVEEFDLMKKVKEDFNKKEEAFNKKYDSLALAWQQKYQSFAAKANRMSQAKAQKRYEALMAEQQQITMMQQQEAQKLQEELEKASEKASGKLKEFMKEYGKKHHYTYIFSRSELAGIAYGKEEKDITEAFIKALNESVKDTTE
jgi:outer membrane protein